MSVKPTQNNVSKTSQEQLAQQFADNLAKNQPIEMQIAIGLISQNMLRGCSWEFVRHNSDIDANLEAFKNNPSVSAQKITYSRSPLQTGYLVYVRLDEALRVFEQSAPGLIAPKELQYASRHHQEAVAQLQAMMTSGYKGVIGIYCTNDSQTITIRGRSYPAFAVTMNELLQLCVRNRYGLIIGGAVRQPNQVQERADAIIEAATVAPSSNALLFEVAPL